MQRGNADEAAVPPTSLRDRWRRGEVTLGLSLMIPSPHLVEMAGLAGFDWVLLDLEHAGIGLETLETMVMAAQASGIACIARPQEPTPAAIGALLDRGALGVQIPHVRSAAEAAAVVRAARFAPLGERSLAVGTRAAGYGLRNTTADFVAQAGETVVCVQIEDLDGLGHLREIARVPGIDVVFMGPSDLSQALGYPGQVEAPAVQAVLGDAFAAIREEGRVAGCAGSPALLARYRGLGVQYLYTHLPTVFGLGAQAVIASITQPQGPWPGSGGR